MNLKSNKGSWTMEFIAWLVAISFGVAFFSNTKADVVQSANNTFVLEYLTTSVVPEWFDFAFERTASQLCSEGYEVLNKTNRPDDLKDLYTRWIITCKERNYN